MKSLFNRLLLTVCLLATALPTFASDLSITAANVTPSANAITRQATAGVGIAAGKLVYKSRSDFKLYLAQGNGSTADIRDCVGVAVVSSSAGTTCTYVIEDPALVIGATVSNGTVYVLSATAGGIAPLADATTGWFPTVVAVGTSSSTVAFRARGIRSGTSL